MSIKSSQARGTLPANNLINGLRPLNGDSHKISTFSAGRDTKNIKKSTSSEQAGPRTNNL